MLVCGGRDFADLRLLHFQLDMIHYARGTKGGDIDVLIHGDAKGADRLARDWARSRGVPIAAFPADWKKYPKFAGPIRNRKMLVVGKPELVVAFVGGRGTQDMVRQARRAGVEVICVGWPKDGN